MRSAGSPNTSLIPPRIRAHGDSWPPSARAAGLARVPSAMSRPESTNVAASMTSEGRTPMKATASPPATAPATWPARKVVWITAVPRTYRSPDKMSGVIAARADSNGGANMVTAKSSATRAAMGTPGTAIAATRTARTASQKIITERRGRRSATSARNRPPITHGR